MKRKESLSISIPSNDTEVKQWLREIKQPIIYFGESAEKRRERLKFKLSALYLKEGKLPVFKSNDIKVEDNNVTNKDKFFIVGSLGLKQARLKIAKDSLKQSAYRIELSKKQFKSLDRIQDKIAYRIEMNKQKYFSIHSSQFVDERGCSHISLHPNGEHCMVSGISGKSYVLS